MTDRSNLAVDSFLQGIENYKRDKGISFQNAIHQRCEMMYLETAGYLIYAISQCARWDDDAEFIVHFADGEYKITDVCKKLLESLQTPVEIKSSGTHEEQIKFYVEKAIQNWYRSIND